jgi:alcohol dehydrogenase YqhD (iron-dependent ADH family)
MLNFVYHIPTKAFFGKGVIERLPEAVSEFGSKVLLVSYKKRCTSEIEICETALALLKEHGVETREYYGVDPNPLIASVAEGASLCRAHGIDLVLAVGGGSAIDCAKGIAAAACYEGDPWELVTDNTKVKKALPIGAILTIAAAGSEMDHTAVISNEKTKEKLHLFSDLVFPSFRHSGPDLYLHGAAVPNSLRLRGHISHAWKCIRQHAGYYVQNRMAEAMMKSVIHYTDAVLANPRDYEARANIMWGVHADDQQHARARETDPMEHALHRAYRQRVLQRGARRRHRGDPAGVARIRAGRDPGLDLHRLCGERLGHPSPRGPVYDGARGGLPPCAGTLFEQLALPKTLRDLGVDEDALPELAKSAVGEGPIKGTKLLLEADVLEILKKAY